MDSRLISNHPHDPMKAGPLTKKGHMAALKRKRRIRI
jgi:hypothetical protein